MVSNRALALLIVATVVVSLGGTLISINKLDQLRTLEGIGAKGVTGLAAGNITLEIQGLSACEVRSNVSFGAAPASDAQISSDVDNSGAGFNDCTTGNTCGGIIITNTGNENLHINFSSQKNVSDFIDGVNVVAAYFQYYIRNGTLSATTGAGCITNTGQQSWTNMPTAANTNVSVCDVLLNATDATTTNITLEFNLTINTTTTPTYKTTEITVNCLTAS